MKCVLVELKKKRLANKYPVFVMTNGRFKSISFLVVSNERRSSSFVFLVRKILAIEYPFFYCTEPIRKYIADRFFRREKT